jgi:hypothetical protein
VAAGASALALTLGLLSGCGGSDGDKMSDRAADQLQDEVAAIEYAAAGEAYGPAQAGLDQLRSTTRQLADRGQLGPDRAARILSQIDRVDQVLTDLASG